MKKILALTFCLSIVATSSFAAVTGELPNAKGFNPTKFVHGNRTIGGTASDAWGAVTAHEKGDKQFWTSNAFGGIGVLTVDPGTALPTATAPATSTDSELKQANFQKM
jgi:hypothetical protein